MDPQGISPPIFEIAWRIAGQWAIRREELALKQREDFTRWMDHTRRRFPRQSRFSTRRTRTDVTAFDELDEQGQEMVERLYQTSLELAHIDRQIASLVRAYLQKNHVYTLTVPAGSYSLESEEGRVDPIEAFLTTPGSKGNCEYFASAMIMMCRSLGIPSRMGVGYLLHEYIEPQDYYLLRQRDAHAWVEIYTADRDWEIFDPTPPSSASQTHAGFLSKAFHQVGTYFEKLQYRWSKYTGWFEFRPEATWAKEVSKWLARLDAGEQPQGQTRSLFQKWFSHHESEPFFYLFLRWMICLLFLVSLSIGVRELYIRLVPKYLRWRTRRYQLKRAIQSPVEFYAKMLEWLSQIDLYKPPSQTGREFARKVVLSRNELACVLELTELYYQVRFGQLPLDQQAEAQAAQALEHLEKVIESIKHQPASTLAVGA